MGDEIEELKNKIRDHELELLTVNDSGERTAIREQISACRKDITALRQQGKFSSHTYIVISQSSRCNPLPNLFRHILVTHPGSATTQGKR
jgi:hypothetical protein